jgi:AcrR family transcriptional regulator
MATDPKTATRTTKGAKAPASRRGVKTRNRILDAAVKVFGERGLVDATMHDIGREAGLSSGTVYRYFVDKADVFDFLLRELEETYRDETSFPLGGRGELLVRESALRFFELYREHAVLYRVLWETLEPPSAFSEAWIEMHNSNRDAIARALRHGKRQGVTVPDLDVPLTAEVAVLLFERPSFTRLIMGWDEDVTDDDVAGVIEGMLGTGVRPGTG